MPPKGYRHVSLREEVYRRLEEFMRSKGLSSINDAIAMLLEYADIYSSLEYLLRTGVRPSFRPKHRSRKNEAQNKADSDPPTQQFSPELLKMMNDPELEKALNEVFAQLEKELEGEA